MSGWQAYYIRNDDDRIVGCVSQNRLIAGKLSNVGTFDNSQLLSRTARDLMASPSPLDQHKPVRVSLVYHSPNHPPHKRFPA